MASAAALKTQFQADEERSSHRHQLWLSAPVSADGETDRVLVHNLSTTGLLFETSLDLDLGDQIEIELPEAGKTPAEIVWCSGEFYGCEFASPVMAAAVSASRLRSPIQQPVVTLATPLAQNEARLPSIDPKALSPLQKAATIVGLATVCWVPIVAAVAYL